MPIVFIPKEAADGETRVSAVPATVKRLVQEGLQVQVETGAGLQSFYSDAEYQQAGAVIVPAGAAAWGSADFVTLVTPPTPQQLSAAKAGASLVSFLYLQRSPELAAEIRSRRLTCFAMEAIPRITRAQKYDALSSQANLAGYQAAILAAMECPKIFPLMMTAAGTLRPARVVIMGAGVAGLQALATARRLGAVVEVADVRPAVKEQVESLGGSYIEVPTDASMETAGGYAREATPEFLKRQAEITLEHLRKADAVITSALVPGKRAPVLISAAALAQLRPGCVIIDMAAEQGGNCELAVAGQTIVHNGVKIIGVRNLAAASPSHASEAYARNLLGIFLDLLDDKSNFAWKYADEIVAAALLARAGELKSA